MEAILEVCNGEGADNVDEDIEIEDEELELEIDRAWVTKNITPEFATKSEVQAMIAAHLEIRHSSVMLLC